MNRVDTARAVRDVQLAALAIWRAEGQSIAAEDGHACHQGVVRAYWTAVGRVMREYHRAVR